MSSQGGDTPTEATVVARATTVTALASTSPVTISVRRGLLPWLVAAALVALVYYLRDVFALFATAFAMAYVLEPLVARLERHGAPRPLAIVVVLLVLGVLATALLSIVVPDIIRELSALAATLPARIQQEWLPTVMTRWLPYLRRRFHLRIPTTTDAWLASIGMKASELAPRTLSALLSAASATVSFLAFMAEVIIVLALAFYLLLDYHRMLDAAHDLVPHRARPRTEVIVRNLSVTMGHYVRGQFLVMGILGGLYACGLGMLGVPAGIGLGLFAGIISFVPYLGFFMALGVSLLLAALDGGGVPHVLAVLGVMVFIHVLDITLVTPRILGGRTGLSPVVVILALVAGGKIMGFAGLLVAIPVAAMIRVLLAEVVSYYKSTTFFLLRPAVDTAGRPPEPDPERRDLP